MHVQSLTKFKIQLGYILTQECSVPLFQNINYCKENQSAAGPHGPKLKPPERDSSLQQG